MNKEKSGLGMSVAALVLSIVAIAMCFWCCLKQKSAPAEAASPDEAAVEAVLQAKPELAYNAYNAYVKEQEKLRLAEIFDPEGFQPIANPDGELTLVEVFDYSCHFCHRMLPFLKEIAKNNPDVKVIAKPVAFLSPASLYGAKASYAAAEQGKYADMYYALFEAEGPLDEAKIDAAAEKIGLDMEKYKADVASEAIANKVTEVQAKAAAAQVNGVPTLILEGNLFMAGSVDDIQNQIDQLKAK